MDRFILSRSFNSRIFEKEAEWKLLSQISSIVKINEEYQNLEISLKMNPRQIRPISGISASSVIPFGSHLDSLGPNFILWSQLYSLAQLCPCLLLLYPFRPTILVFPHWHQVGHCASTKIGVRAHITRPVISHRPRMSSHCGLRQLVSPSYCSPPSLFK